MRERTFFRNFRSVLTSNITGIGMTAVSTLIAIRSLSIAGWAIAAIIISLGPLGATVMSLGSVPYHVRELSGAVPVLARAHYFRFVTHRLAWATIVVSLSIVAAVIAHAMLPLSVAMLAASRFIRTGSTLHLVANRRFNLVAVVIVAEKFVSLVFVGIVAFTADFTIYTLPTAYTFGSVLASMLALVLTFVLTKNMKASVHPPAQRFDAFFIWRGSRNFGITSLSTSAQQLDVPLVTLVAGATVGGHFAAAARVPGALSVVGSALALVVIPTFSSGPLTFAKADVRRLLSLYLAVFAGSLSLIFTAGWWVPFMLGNEYVLALSTIRIYLLAVTVNAVFQPAIALLQARKLDRFAARIILLQVPITLCTQAILANQLGAAGAALAHLVILALATVVAIVVIFKKILNT